MERREIENKGGHLPREEGAEQGLSPGEKGELEQSLVKRLSRQQRAGKGRGLTMRTRTQLKFSDMGAHTRLLPGDIQPAEAEAEKRSPEHWRPAWSTLSVSTRSFKITNQEFKFTSSSTQFPFQAKQ